METVGEYFKLKREEHNLTFADISAITKIRPQYLEAIENNDFSLFSSPQILKGYVKSIAVAINADSEYVSGILGPQIKETFKDKNVEDILGDKLKEERLISSKLRKRILIILLAILSAAVLFYFSYKILDFLKYKSTSSFVMPASPSNKIISNGYLKKADKNNIKYAVALTVRAIRKTWVAVIVDNKSQKTYMLYPGDVQEWQAKKNIIIKIGNAGGVKLNYNGKNLGKLGKEKEVITMNFPMKTG